MTESAHDEKALWLRAREHDGRAFQTIFDLHRDRVFRHTLRLVDGTHDAEEVTAAAFFELWRRRETVRLANGSVLPWLLVTSGNLARNARRSIGRYRALFDRLPRSEGSSEIAVGGMESDTRVDAALRTLAPTDVSLITLTVLEGYPIIEAAAVLGLSDGAARTRLHRAKRRLRERLGEPEFDVQPATEGESL